MASVHQEPLDLVLSKYDLKVLNVRTESYKDKKGVWWIQTPAGYKILKKISNSQETLRYIISAVKHLSANGILLPAINPTRDGSDYVNMGGTCYILLNAVEGKNPNYGSSSELTRVVKELARFHKASAGFSPLPDSKPKRHLGTWIVDYQQQIEDMERFYKKETTTDSKSSIAQNIIQEFPYFQQRALKAIEGLKAPEYANWVIKSEKTGCLCHQDFSAGNLILNPDGKLYVLDTDSITIDIAARDIRKLLNKIMKKKGKWDMELTKKILAIYQSENPLTRPEWNVVKLDLMFPHLFIGAMDKYYYQRDKEWSAEKYLQRIKEMSAFEKTITPLLENFDSVIPV